MAQDRPYRHVTDADSDGDTDAARPSREDLVAAARAVVYDEEGDLIPAEDLDDALRAHGVVVGENEDGGPEYRNVPRDLPLSACHLAVDLRRDPADFISDSDENPLDAEA